jgi:MYXO-CTERM domain-containing protein
MMITFNNYGRVLIAGAVLLSSRVAAAQTGECSADADCEGGFSCKVVGSSGCAGVDCDPEAPDCEPVECDPQELRACVPADCDSDVDCATGFVCHEFNDGACTSPACPPGEECEQAPDCEETTRSQCTPRYTLPCQSANDCGAGFDCVTTEREQCTCSGGGSVGVPPTGAGGSAPVPDDEPKALNKDGGSTPPVAEPDCSCTTEEVTYCKLQEIACNGDSDCPETWSCASNGGGEDPGEAPVGRDTVVRDAGAALPTETTRGADAAVTLVGTTTDAGAGPTSTSICMPPYYNGGPRDDDPNSGGGGEPTTPGEDDEDPSEDGSSPDAAAPGTVDDADTAADAAAPDQGEEDSGVPSAGDGERDLDDGCACNVVGASAAPSRSAWGALGLLGIGLLRRRRAATRRRA